MELPNLGQHCAASSCNKLDFLPFTCDLCKQVFCIDHHKYDAHNCAESYQKDVQVPICPLCNQPVPSKRGQPPDLAVNDHMENNCKHKNKKIYTNKCSAMGCKVKELVPVTCDSCKLNYCLRHRHTLDHDCKGPMSARDKAAMAAAARTSNKNQGSSSSTSHKSKTNQSSSQSILKYLTSNSGGPRPTGHNQPSRSHNISSIQGSLSEDEALARAMAASMEEANGSGPNQSTQPSGQATEDELMAQAIAASLGQRQPREAQQHGNGSSSCNLC